jgi:hypothetical protein
MDPMTPSGPPAKPTREVKIPKTWLNGATIPETSVLIDADGAVIWRDRLIGHVWKGTRTYSPPTHRGSRIVRFHKQVPEWQGNLTGHTYGRRYHCDTRQAVIQLLIADILNSEEGEGDGC